MTRGYASFPSRDDRMRSLEERMTRLERAPRIPFVMPIPIITSAWASTVSGSFNDLLVLRHIRTHDALTICLLEFTDSGCTGTYQLWDYDNSVELTSHTYASAATRVARFVQIPYSGNVGDVRMLAVRGAVTTGADGIRKCWAMAQYAYGDVPVGTLPPVSPGEPDVPPAWPPPPDPT